MVAQLDGCRTDSYYEYLLKVAVLLNWNASRSSVVTEKVDEYLAQFDLLLAALPAHVVEHQGCTRYHREAGRGAPPLFANERYTRDTTDSSHLSCYLPGVLALAALRFPDKHGRFGRRHTTADAAGLATQLMDGCTCQYELPEISAAGLGPE
eukprot:SAG31_NODE_16057_length_725_cov_0.814696_1_plen_151_part_10